MKLMLHAKIKQIVFNFFIQSNWATEHAVVHNREMGQTSVKLSEIISLLHSFELSSHSHVGVSSGSYGLCLGVRVLEFLTRNDRDHNERENKDCASSFIFIHFIFIFSFLSRAVAHTPVPLTSPLFPSVYCFFTILALKPLERLGGEADGGINRYLRGWMAINIPLWHWTQNRIYGPVLSPGICCCCGVLERAELTRGNRCASTFFCRERWSKQFSL